MDLTLIIFAALALFLSYRLFNVLGTRGGHEPEEHDRPVLRPVGANDTGHDADEALQQRPEPVTPQEELPAWAQTVRETAPRFEPKEFLEGAATAYEMVVQGFADGDLSSVRGFVDAEVLGSFEEAIAARVDAGQRVELTFVGIETPKVLSVERDADELRAEIEFRSEQVRAVRDAEGKVIEGSDEQVISVTDRWVFTRPVRSNDPNWTLVATQGTGS